MGTNVDKINALNIISSIFLCKPTKKAIKSWKELLSETDYYILSDLKQEINKFDMESKKNLEQILWEYTRLFIGPYKLLSPPWESVYTSPKRLMMQDAYDELKLLYSQAGLEINDENVMLDHIAVEINFLSVLLKKISMEDEKKEFFKDILTKFLNEHIFVWVSNFLNDLDKATEENFYKILSSTTRKILKTVSEENI